MAKKKERKKHEGRMLKTEYPKWEFPTKRAWLRQSRKQWNEFKKTFYGKNGVNCGSLFYPQEVYEFLQKTYKEMMEMDKIMKHYYKNA